MFKRRRSKLAIALWALAAVFALVLFTIETKLEPAILDIARARTVQAAVEEVNLAVRNCARSQSIDYADLVSIHKDDTGHIVAMQANTGRINEVAADFALEAERRIRAMQQEDFTIPLGQVLGSQLLATYGPCIPVHVIPVGAVQVNMVDKFESAGINQTRHRICLEFDTDVRIVIPWHNTEVKVATSVPLVENIVVGKVPSTYVSIDGGLLSQGLYRSVQPLQP